MEGIRVLHCPDIVGGNPPGLARAERELGLNSWAIAFRQNVFSYSIDEVLLKSPDNALAYITAILRLFWKALWDYDVIHYNFGQTIFPYRIWAKISANGFLRLLGKVYLVFFSMIDLQILRNVGKHIVVTFQGNDARQGDYSIKNFEISIAHFVEPGYYTPESDADKRRIIRNFDRYAHLIYYLNPDLGNVLPDRARFLPYAHVDMRTWEVVPPKNKPRPLVVHAPSHRGTKGTDVVLQTIALLKNDGVNFDFQLIEEMPNSDARQYYEDADLLIDQLYAGWYGGLAVELMALGKPVVSYIRQSDLGFIPEKMRQELPVISVTVETIYDVLKRWINDRDGLLEVGKSSRAYVEKWHDPLKIAARLRDDYVSMMTPS